MTADERNDKRFYWGAIVFVAFMSASVLSLMIFPDLTRNIPLLPFVLAGCIFVCGMIVRMHWQICDLRRQVSKLEQKLGLAAEPPQGQTAKEAYAKDDDGQRRLHISRLQTFLLFVLPGALTLL